MAMAVPGEVAAALPLGWQAAASTLIFADVVESVRLIDADQVRNAWRISQLLDSLVQLATGSFGAELLERRGDGLLLCWSGQQSRAAACALQLAALADTQGRGDVDDDRILLRFGLHCGDMLRDGARVYGSQVNMAARVAALAAPGQVVLSQAMRDCITPGLDGELVDLGDCWVKHVAEPVRVYRWAPAGRTQAEARLPEPSLPCPCIAVLPFRMTAMRGTADQEAIAELIGENIVHALSRTDQLAVVSWFSTRRIAPGDAGLADTANKLGAGWIVSGSCAGEPGRLVIGVELLDAHNNAVAWTARINSSLSDLLEAEPACAGEVAQGLVQRVCEGEAKRLARHALPNLASHSILTGAIGLMHRSARDSFLKSREALEYLLERHPRMHAVRPWLAQWYVLKNTRSFGQEPKADAAHAIAQTRRALDALPQDARALALLGFAHFHLLDDVDTAERHLDLAVQANPNDPLALTFTAAVKSSCRKADEGLGLSISALRIAPFDPLRDYMRGIAAGCALSCGDLALGSRLAEQSLRENAAHPYAWRVLLIASALQGELDKARQAHQRLLQLGVQLTVASYRLRSKLRPQELDLATQALRAAGVPEH
jgi:class 3 adenylate cyclase/TolB-like protein